jgi:hypothetical protein
MLGDGQRPQGGSAATRPERYGLAEGDPADPMDGAAEAEVTHPSCSLVMKDGVVLHN